MYLYAIMAAVRATGMEATSPFQGILVEGAEMLTAISSSQYYLTYI
jgi:hypothetical protein